MAKPIKTKFVRVWNPAGAALTLLNPNKKGNEMNRKQTNKSEKAKPKKRTNGALQMRRYRRAPNPAPLGKVVQGAVGVIGGMVAVETVTRFIPLKFGWIGDVLMKLIGGYLLSIGAEKVTILKPYADGIAISGAALAVKDVISRFFPDFPMSGGIDTSRLRPMRPRRVAPAVGPPPGTTPMLPPSAVAPGVPVAVSTAPGAGVSDWDYYDEMADFEPDEYYMNDLVSNFPYGGLADLVTNFNP
jgi:hypothetical protein